MNQKNILIVSVVLVLAVAGFLGVKAFGGSSSSGGDIEITPSNGLTEKLDFEVGSKNDTSDNRLVEIEMTAKKFEFSPNVIRVKEGDTVKMTITSLDVTHGFAINELNVSQRIPAGETTTFEFVASKKGDFRFYCNVVCGIGHSGMVGDIFVE